MPQHKTMFYPASSYTHRNAIVENNRICRNRKDQREVRKISMEIHPHIWKTQATNLAHTIG